MESLSSIGLIGAFAGGLVSFFSPCTLPLLPGYLSVVTGGSVNKRDKKLEALILSVFFVAGFTLVFITLGLGASSISQFLRGYRQELNWITGSVVILLGIFMTGLLSMPVFQRTLQFTPRFQGGSPLSATAFGVSFAIGHSLRRIIRYRLDALYRPHPRCDSDGHLQCRQCAAWNDLSEHVLRRDGVALSGEYALHQQPQPP